MKKILIIGSLNMDLVSFVQHLPKEGETIASSKFLKVPGGKGANQAVAAAKLGANVNMIGRVGLDDHGNELLLSLRNSNVNSNAIIQEGITGMAFITVAKSGENNIVLVPGANSELTKKDIELAEHLIEESDLIIMQLEIPIDVVEYVLEIAKKLKKDVILNPAPAMKLSNEILHNVHTLIPNEVELEMLTGYNINSDTDIFLAAKKLMSYGVKRVLVTLGERGSILVTEFEQVKIPAHKVNPIDTTAAGDSYIAAFAVGLTKGMTNSEAAIFATRVAAVVVTREGAQSSIPTLDELEDPLITNA